MFAFVSLMRKKEKIIDWDTVPTDHFLLKYSYIGTNFYGSAAQDHNRTVDGVLFDSLQFLKLIKDRNSCRCARTDKGVHALGNYMSIRLKVKTDGTPYDYCTMLNSVLPTDVRVLGVKQIPSHFDARFNCLYRIYKYTFVRHPQYKMDLMREAASHLIGEHDFRNFCKIDLLQVRHFRRKVMDVRVDERGSVAILTVIGNAFLWHQIRCFMSVLLLVAQGLESPDITKKLLDVESEPKKPCYHLADESGLCLYDCVFEGLHFEDDGSDTIAIRVSGFAEQYEKALRDTAVLGLLSMGAPGLESAGRYHAGVQGPLEPLASHIPISVMEGPTKFYKPLLTRARTQSLEERATADSKLAKKRRDIFGEEDPAFAAKRCHTIEDDE